MQSIQEILSFFRERFIFSSVKDFGNSGLFLREEYPITHEIESFLIEHLKTYGDQRYREGVKKGRNLLDRIYCEIHGVEEYFVEEPHPDCNGKGLYADLFAKCGFIVATFHDSKNQAITEATAKADELLKGENL